MPEKSTQILTGDYVCNMTLGFFRDDDVIDFVQIITEAHAQIKMGNLVQIMTDYKIWFNWKTTRSTRLEVMPNLRCEISSKSWQMTTIRSWRDAISKIITKNDFDKILTVEPVQIMT